LGNSSKKSDDRHAGLLGARAEGSALAIRLAELGYKLQFRGTGTRNTSSGFVPVDIIETKLPGR
jgi:hypothetical protein